MPNRKSGLAQPPLDQFFICTGQIADGVDAHQVQLLLPLIAFCESETEQAEEIAFDDLLSIPSIGLRFF
jgi:hypothetical protein